MVNLSLFQPWSHWRDHQRLGRRMTMTLILAGIYLIPLDDYHLLYSLLFILFSGRDLLSPVATFDFSLLSPAERLHLIMAFPLFVCTVRLPTRSLFSSIPILTNAGTLLCHISHV
ncbi:hypothetical protein TRIATDRAFT_300839 [Trichoderma atroviride IMI 206040]|uniref:Uncharacterized protein n=1 Tax=Hypocrea atroviridis (strain ATCC 20476 / IMI 206040) TaxID=452589 RepID=G9P322_HYPAI|nr:uncharacterized protein TRIATDRAFT_300839 [Trichoderma atroviride IMI 206040]EHK42793.1 hypothetical protein TRIATDRAFT_300839 [Trichoderma atroviride IMI 206040]